MSVNSKLHDYHHTVSDNYSCNQLFSYTLFVSHWRDHWKLLKEIPASEHLLHYTVDQTNLVSTDCYYPITWKSVQIVVLIWALDSYTLVSHIHIIMYIHNTYTHTYVHIYVTYIHSHIHTYICTYMHTYVHNIYICTCV